MNKVTFVTHARLRVQPRASAFAGLQEFLPAGSLVTSVARLQVQTLHRS